MLIFEGSGGAREGVDRVRDVIQDLGFDSRVLGLARAPAAAEASVAREEETVV
jgi:hypothetical protein